MPEIANLGRILIVLGVAIIVLGIIVVLVARIPGIGQLPGSILIRRDGIVFYFPILGCLILSIILTIILNVILRLTR